MKKNKFIIFIFIIIIFLGVIKFGDLGYLKYKNDIEIGGDFYYNEELEKADFETFKRDINCCDDYGYVKNNGKIYFYQDENLLEVKNVDLGTFEILSKNYAKDKNDIYRLGKKIGNVDLNTFEILGAGYTKDKSSIYYNNEKINNVDIKTFKVLGGSYFYYAKDKNNVYLRNEKIEGVDVQTFEVVNYEVLDSFPYYTKDKNNVYYAGKKMKGIDSETFDSISWKSYMSFKDKNNCYKEGIVTDMLECKIGVVDIFDFVVYRFVFCMHYFANWINRN